MAPSQLAPDMAIVDAEAGRGVAGRVAALVPDAGAGDLAYGAFMGLALPATVLLAVGALPVGPSGAGLAAGIVLFVVTTLVFEAGWYVGSGDGE